MGHHLLLGRTQAGKGRTGGWRARSTPVQVGVLVIRHNALGEGGQHPLVGRRTHVGEVVALDLRHKAQMTRHNFFLR